MCVTTFCALYPGLDGSQSPPGNSSTSRPFNGFCQRGHYGEPISKARSGPLGRHVHFQFILYNLKANPLAVNTQISDLGAFLQLYDLTRTLMLHSLLLLLLTHILNMFFTMFGLYTMSTAAGFQASVNKIVLISGTKYHGTT